jgi:hypothetical protein
VLPSGAPAPGHDRTAHQHGRTAQQHGRPTPPPGRPLEHRDLVEERQARLDRTFGVVVALVLGALLAGFIAWAVS